MNRNEFFVVKLNQVNGTLNESYWNGELINYLVASKSKKNIQEWDFASEHNLINGSGVF